MKKTRWILGFLALLAILCKTNAQEKYAVLLAGDYMGNNTINWNGDESWNDIFLMWEMLVGKPVEQGGKGYSNDNVFVLFADGVDYSENSYVVPRYDAEITYSSLAPITHGACDSAMVEEVFNGLATGTGGYPKVEEDDFLFIWTFVHLDNT